MHHCITGCVFCCHQSDLSQTHNGVTCFTALAAGSKLFAQVNIAPANNGCGHCVDTTAGEMIDYIYSLHFRYRFVVMTQIQQSMLHSADCYASHVLK